MTWPTRSRRRTQLPPNWDATTRRIKKRDGHQCTWTDDGQRCTETTQLEVDHIGDPHDHHDDNLRTLCHPHHLARTARQGAAAAAAWRRNNPRRRPPPPHPGTTR